MVLLAASALHAPTPAPTTTSGPPPDPGLSDEEVLAIAIPKYREAKERAKRDTSNGFWLGNFFEASLAGTATTDLGLSGRSFLVAAVSTQFAPCDGCYSAKLVVIDLRTRTVAWRLDLDEAWLLTPDPPEAGGDPGEPPVVRVFRVFPDDPVKTIAFGFTTHDPFHGQGSVTERWLRPRITPNGDLYFETLWEGEVESWAGGIGDFNWPYKVRSTWTSLWPRRAYRLTTQVATDWDTVKLTTSQEFTQRPDDRTFVAEARRIVRLENGGASTFPFNLPMASLSLDPALLATEASTGRARCVRSPDSELFVEAVNGDWGRPPAHLRIYRMTDGAQVRDVWSGQPGLENDGLRFTAVGWTIDGSRCLAVVGLGLDDIPPVLVSLTANGKGDRWEGFLPEGYQLPDGFILDLPQSPAKSTKHSTKP